MLLISEMYAELLSDFPNEKASLTKFLQPQKYEKLRWIHELSQSRYQDAGHTLCDVASRERRLRQKKLSLSIAKLSLLVVGHGMLEEESVDIGVAAVNAQLHFAEDIIKPIVRNCIDNQARVEVALDTLYIARNLKKSHLRTRLVRRGLEVLVDERNVDPETLVDLFTLKKRGSGSSAEAEFETYFWALQILRAADVRLLGEFTDISCLNHEENLRKSSFGYVLTFKTSNTFPVSKAYRSWPKIEGYALDMPEYEVEAAWRATAVYQIIRNAMNFQVMGTTLSVFRPLSPSESLLPGRNSVIMTISPRLSGWPEADIDRYCNELLAESEMLKKWAGKLEGDESRLLTSLQSLAKKELDGLSGESFLRHSQELVSMLDENDSERRPAESKDVEMHDSVEME